MKPTAFVAHPDPPRHDTGWGHPEHQGRLPALARAVHRDMLALHEVLLEVEGRHATEEELLLAHTPGYVDRVRRAAEAAERAGAPQPFGAEGRISGASWDAALAAVGCALAGIEAVRAGRAGNAFCAVRPPGRDAGPDGSGKFGLFNPVAVAARHLRRNGAERVLVVDWGAAPPLGTPAIVRADPGIRLVSIHGMASAASPSGVPAQDEWNVAVAAGTGGAAFAAAQAAALERATAGWTPQWIVLAAGFDILAADPLGSLGVEPAEVHGQTLALRERAEQLCGGRLLSVLEGGFDPSATGRAAVQHLRALAGLPPA